jgi:hypothetical protein
MRRKNMWAARGPFYTRSSYCRFRSRAATHLPALPWLERAAARPWDRIRQSLYDQFAHVADLTKPSRPMISPMRHWKRGTEGLLWAERRTIIARIKTNVRAIIAKLTSVPRQILKDIPQPPNSASRDD